MDFKYNKHLVVVSFHLKTVKLAMRYRLTDRLALGSVLDSLNFINATLVTACQELRRTQINRTNIRTVRFVIYLIKDFVEYLTAICKKDGIYADKISADSVLALHSHATRLQGELEWIFEHVTDTSYNGRKEIISDEEYKMLFESDDSEDEQ